MEGKYSPGKPARKFYLSEEAAAMLFAESKRSTYPMSTLVDMAIKKCYGPQPAPTFPPTPQEVFASLSEEQARLAQLMFAPPRATPAPPVDMETATEVRARLEELPARRPAPTKKDDPFDF